MEILFLGTSSGTPTVSRNVSSVAVRRKNSKTWCMVDCGEGTQHQLLKTNLSLNSLEAIFITHVHGDHCFGLPGLLSSATMLGRKEVLRIFAPKEVEEFIQVSQSASQSHQSYAVEFTDIHEYDSTISCSDFAVDVHGLSHRVPSYAYSFTEINIPNKLDTKKLIAESSIPRMAWGQIQKGQDIILEDGRSLKAVDYLLPPRRSRTIVVAGDNDRPELLGQISKESHVLIHESTYTQAIANRIGPGPQHSSAESVAKFAESVDLKNLILTHFSPRYKDGLGKDSIEEIWNEAKQFYSGNLFLAEDFSLFSLDFEGNITLM